MSFLSSFALQALAVFEHQGHDPAIDPSDQHECDEHREYQHRPSFHRSGSLDRFDCAQRDLSQSGCHPGPLRAEAVIRLTDVAFAKILDEESRVGVGGGSPRWLPPLYVVDRCIEPGGFLRSLHAGFMRL